MAKNRLDLAAQTQPLPPVPAARWFVLIVLAVLAFGLCLKGDFYMDDYLHILDDDTITEGTWWEKKMRALPYILWCSTYQLFGFAAPAFHAWNLAVHVLTACALIPTIRSFLTAGNWLRDDRQRLDTATAAAFLFAVHPLCSEPVNYTRCLMIALVNLFTVLSVWSATLACQATGRRQLKLVAVTLLALTGALFSKTPGIFHAGTAVAITWLLFGNFKFLTAWIHRQTDVLAALSIATIAVGKLWPFADYWIKVATFQFRSPDFLPHLLTQGRVFWAYLGKFFWPTDLSSDHRVPQSISTADTPAVLGLALAALLLVTIAIAIFNKRTRLYAAFAALGLTHLYLRFLFNNNEFMVEYRVYPAMPWLCALAASALIPWVLQLQSKKLLGYASAALLLACVTTSALRSAVWTDSSTLARDVLDQYPTNNRARGILMLNTYRAGDYHEVHSLHQQACTMTDAVEAKNQRLRPHGREYDMVRLYVDQAATDRILTLALTELKGADYALQFADFAIDRIIGKRHEAGGRTRTKRIEAALVELRDFLRDDYSEKTD